MKRTIFFAIIAIVTLFSCTPESSKMTKAVILDSRERVTDAQTHYVVYLPSYKVKDYVIMYPEFEIGDTILIHDRWRNFKIQ